MSRPSLENEINALAQKLRDKKARLRAKERAARDGHLALLGGLFKAAGLAHIDAQEAAGALGLYAAGLTKPGAEELQRRAREKGAELLP